MCLLAPDSSKSGSSIDTVRLAQSPYSCTGLQAAVIEMLGLTSTDLEQGNTTAKQRLCHEFQSLLTDYHRSHNMNCNCLGKQPTLSAAACAGIWWFMNRHDEPPRPVIEQGHAILQTDVPRRKRSRNGSDGYISSLPQKVWRAHH